MRFSLCRAMPAVFFTICLCAVGLVPTAHADSIFNFSITGSGISAIGTFTANTLSGVPYLVTGISGLLNGTQQMSLTPPQGFGTNDNLLFPNPPPPFVDANGIGFIAGGVNYTLYGCNSTTFLANGQQNPPPIGCGTGTQVGFTFALANPLPAPEPSTWALLVLGLVALLCVMRRYRSAVVSIP